MGTRSTRLEVKTAAEDETEVLDATVGGEVAEKKVAEGAIKQRWWTVGVEMVTFESATGGSIVKAAGVSVPAGKAAVGSATVETAAVGPVVPEMELVSC